ncbi:BatA and WFA domain-containing protein [Candidatus Woesearchaeota archaeon]|nr:BatA and WFA domain-containing protein [Candidatus Woesearchaeota archaeon]
MAGWTSFITGQFLDPKLLPYAAGLVLIFILFYFIKPKPKQFVMPTLMFLFKDMGRHRTANILRKLITNILFIMQLLIIVFIAFSSAKPFIDVSKETLFKNTVIVLDASASMKAPYQGETRFEEAVRIAKENLGSINTLILVKKIPEVSLVDETAGKVRSIISEMEATDSPTNLYAAISTAGTYAKADSRIVVISDFIDTGSEADLNTIKKTIESQGIKVDFLKVRSPVPNVGIVDLTVSDSKTTAVAKNFNPEEASVRLKINDLSEEMIIAGGSREIFSFTTPPLTSKLELEVLSGNDEFKLDNQAYISAPGEDKKKVLFITNNADYKKTFIYNALDVMKGVELTVAIPPKIPALGEFDLYFFKDIDPNLLLPGTYTGIKKEIETKGKAAVVMAQTNLLAINYQGILPVVPSTLEKGDAINIITTGNEGIMSGLELGVTKKYFGVESIEGRTLSVLASSEYKVPIIAFNKMGEGKVVYYGILDEDVEAETFFAKSPAFFVFWKRTVDFITNTPSVKNLNYRTGSYISFPEEQTIQTPKGKIKTNELVLDQTGLYTLQDRTIAINLADEKESDIGKEETEESRSYVKEGERFKEKVPYELTDNLVYAAIILLILELIYVKLRGDF